MGHAPSQCSRSRSLSVQQVTLPLSAAVPKTAESPNGRVPRAAPPPPPLRFLRPGSAGNGRVPGAPRPRVPGSPPPSPGTTRKTVEYLELPAPRASSSILSKRASFGDITSWPLSGSSAAVEVAMTPSTVRSLHASTLIFFDRVPVLDRLGNFWGLRRFSCRFGTRPPLPAGQFRVDRVLGPMFSDVW